MVGRYFLLFLGIISLFWIIYVGFDLVDRKNQFLPANLFGTKDGKVLLINRSDECTPEMVGFNYPTEIADILSKVDQKTLLESRLYLSEKQIHFMIEKKGMWNKQNVSDFFKLKKEQIKFSSRHSFELKGFLGKFNQSRLYIYYKDVKSPSSMAPEWLKMDQKSSASVIDFTSSKTIVSDIYVKADKQVVFSSQTHEFLKGKQVEDQRLFAVALPNDLSNYHFFEKEYYGIVRPDFVKNPMYEWMETGFVGFEYEGKQVVLTDFISGQDPILLLNDLVGSTNIKSTEGMGYYLGLKNLPFLIDSDLTGVYVKTMDNFVAISASKSACEQVVAAYKLGNTIAAKKDKVVSLFGSLPQKVSERVSTDTELFSRTIYGNKLIETRVVKGGTISLDTQPKVPESSNKSTISMFVGGDIKDFTVKRGNGNAVILTEEGNLQCFEKGKLKWKKEIGSRSIGKIQYIDAYANGEEQLLLTTEDALHFLDKNGKELTGFPLVLKSKATCSATFYRWKNEPFFVVGNESNEITIYDTKGRSQSVFQTHLSSIVKPIDVWISQRKLFVGAKDQKEFVFYQVEKKKEYRRFKIDPNSFSVKIDNQMLQFSMFENQLCITDQKGVRKTIDKYDNGKIRRVIEQEAVRSILVEAEGVLHFLDYEGHEFASLKVPFSDLGHVELVRSPNGVLYATLLDAIENKVYLYQLHDQQLSNIPIEGKTQVALTWDNNNQMLISTVIDDYLMQYIQK